MRVLHLSSEASWRGGEQQIAYLLKELIKMEVEVKVVCRKQSPFEAFCEREKIAYTPVSFKHQYHFATAEAIKKESKSFNADLIHLHSSKSHGAAVLAAVLGNKVPLILSRRVDFPVKKSFLSQFKYNYKGIEKIICVSDVIKKMTAAGIKYPEKLVTVHSGIDLQKFDPDNTDKSFLHTHYNIPKDRKLIGNTSALAPHKDYYTFIDTASFLLQQRKDLHFLIIGKGALQKDLENYAATKGIDAHITFTGFLNNIPKILPCLDIFLMTSETEGLGTSVLDAFAAKVPVVATDGGGIPEMIIHEKTGMLASVKSSKQLAIYVQDVLNDKVLQKNLIKNASEKIKDFSKEQTALKTLEIYKEVLSSKY
jgi:glycosyltransferase involved in cell wall biosynthesis